MINYQTKTRVRSGRDLGFTVIEILAVILIILTLMAAIMPAFMSSLAASQRNECRKNMRAIANAQGEYRLKNYPNHYYADTLANLQAKVPINVACSTTGTYTFTSTDTFHTNFTVVCSISAHNAGYGSEPAGFTPGSNTQ